MIKPQQVFIGMVMLLIKQNVAWIVPDVRSHQVKSKTQEVRCTSVILASVVGNAWFENLHLSKGRFPLMSNQTLSRCNNAPSLLQSSEYEELQSRLANASGLFDI
jgi:hypothetical protein